jgi:ankyrin repeat protein
MKTKQISKIFFYLFIIILTNSCYKSKKDSIKSKKNESLKVQEKSVIHDNKINDYISVINGDEYTKLGLACKNNKISDLKELVELNVDFNLAKTDGVYEYDALYVAIENKNIEIVKYLIKNKVNINKIYNEEGLNPLALAAKLNEIEIVKILLKNGVSIEVENMADIDYQEIPLFIALENNNYEMIKLLIDYKANINIKNNKGEVFKDIIIINGWQELIK